MPEQNISQNDQEIKVSTDQAKLEQYRDLSGVTIKKLDLGLWWVMNVKFFKKTLFWFVVVLGTLAWLYTLANFGYYLTIGMNKDDRLVESMVTANVNKQALVAPDGLTSGDVELFASAGDRFDFLVNISNTNPDYYAEFNYSFIVNGSTTPAQTGFILPAEQKKIVTLGLAWPENIRTVGLSIANLKWHRINKHEIPDWANYRDQHLAINISDPVFSPAESSGLTEKINVSEISFTVGNDSPYNYYRLPLNVFLYSFDRVVGVYQASLDNVRSGESRNVRLNYSGAVDRVDRIEVAPDLNIMRADIYFKLTGSN